MKRKLITLIIAGTIIISTIVTPLVAFAAGTDETNDDGHAYTLYTYTQSHFKGGRVDDVSKLPTIEHLTEDKLSDHIHVWEDDSEDAVPDCTTGTTKHYRCKICNHSWNYGEISQDAVGHKYDESTWVIDKEPTCTESGLKHQTCRVCGENGAAELNTVIPATGHKYKWVVTKKATCTDYEYRSFVCSACGDVKIANVKEKYDNTGEKTEGFWKEPLGHDFQYATLELNNGIKTPATCTSDATYYQVCTRCSEKDEDACNKVHGTQIEHKFEDGRCVDCGKIEWIYKLAKKAGLTKEVLPRQ